VTGLSTEPLPPGTFLKGRYEVVRLIKGGGMSWIYQVREHRQDATTQIWAMKELRLDSDDSHTVAEAEQLFAQEAHILVHLSHPNLPRVAAFFTEGQRSYLVMEYIQGESLQERLAAAHAPLLESQVVAWGIQICGVLSYLHGQNPPVIFRDIKPSNVMVTPAGEIKLIDFGIARTYKAGKQRDTISMGSENYAAPEQWGQAQTDARSDVYAVGATLYHLLANEPPLPAFVPGERISLRQRNPSASERIEQIIECAMARDRADRYRSAEEMRQALLRLLSPWERLRLAGQSASIGQASSSTVGTPGTQAADQPARTIDRSHPSEAMVGTAPQPLPLRSTTVEGLVYCPRCGGANRVHARFCARCGERIVPTSHGHLEILHPANRLERLDLDGDSLVIGRRSPQRPVDLDLGPYDPNGYVSRQHARLARGPTGLTITDLRSSNGTFLNGSRLPEGVPFHLEHGDIIRMGQVELKLVLTR